MMKYTAIKFCLLLLVLMGFNSCQKDIVVKELPYDSTVIIECMLTPGALPKLFLNRGVAFFDPRVDNSDLVMRNALVIIQSDLGPDTLQLDSIKNLFTCQYEFYYRGHQMIAENSAYQLDLTVEGKYFHAETSTQLPRTAVTFTDYAPKFQDIYGEHEGVIVEFNDIAGGPNNYRYQMDRLIDSSVTYGETHVYSLCTNGSFFNVQEIGRSVYTDANQDGLGQRIVVEPAFKHKAGAEGYIRIQTIDDNAAKFYDELDKQKLGIYNPFVEPVFLHPVQFEEAIGVFGAYVLSDSVLFVYPE
jgi:hypothetical protein